MNTYDLSGEVAIVTGGAQGIGYACAERFLASGATVILWDIDEGEIDRALGKLSGPVSADTVDISDYDAVEAAAKSVFNSHGKLSILVNSAGIAGMNAQAADYPVDEWKRIIDLNLNGTFYTNRAVVPLMREGGYGRIVNIASIAGKEGNPNASAYSASKAGVIGFTKSLGKELAAHDIAVNCVTPAGARTRIFDQMTEEHVQFMLSKVPRGRFVEIEEIASMVAWLSSRENSFTTAGVFDISGGRATY